MSHVRGHVSHPDLRQLPQVLIAYFRNARLPTGIQRVQIEVICGLLKGEETDLDVRICCFGERHDDWVEIPAPLFRSTCELALADGDVEAREWVAQMQRLRMLLSASPPLEFPEGAYLKGLICYKKS